MGYSPVNVSNNLLRRAFDEDVAVSPMKLQKLLFFTSCEYAKRTHTPLIDGTFQTWKYGPVERSVYDEFRSFGGNRIRAYGKDAAGKAWVVDEQTDPQLREVIDIIWGASKNRSAVDLSRITHREGSAWYKAYQRGWISAEEMEADQSYRPELGLSEATPW
ncbi:putative phage-associated protein [Rathayibacter agropyri]